ncbi:MAG: hypothetical protein ABIJ23_05100 [Candidatus Magasanikbacteria bacterium]
MQINPNVEVIKMNWIIWTLIVVVVITSSIAIFLGREMLKKFGYMHSFVQSSNQLITWSYSGGRKSGMYNIVLRGPKNFSALVGFNLKIPVLGYSGYDYYGQVDSNQNGVAVISTYLGKGATEFQFLVSRDLEHCSIEVASGLFIDQELTPDVVYPPHWYQKLGFYG